MLLLAAAATAVGLCWSADGFQLACLDDSSTLKLWAMAPEQLTQQQREQGRHFWG
jgi:hypothetical protein